MTYEYRSDEGLIRLVQVGGWWRLEYGGARKGNWPSASAAVAAVSRHASGLEAWDELGDTVEASEDLLDWTPLGENL